MAMSEESVVPHRRKVPRSVHPQRCSGPEVIANLGFVVRAPAVSLLADR